MGSSNPSTTTTVNKVEIPPWLEPHMQRIAGDAGALYAEGVGPQYYPNQTWIDFNPYQVEAQRLIGETAVTNDLSPRAYDTAAGIMDYGGVSHDGFGAVAPVHDIASGAQRINTGPQYQELVDSIRNGNPYFQDLLAQQSERIADAVNSQFSGSGRYASGAHTDALTKRIGELQTSTLAQQYNADVQNRMAGLLGLSNVEGTNIQNRLGAGMNLGNFYQGAQDDAFRAALAAPSLAASRYADWDRLLDLGGQFEARDAQMLKDAIDRFEFQNQMPWNQLGMYGQQLQGVNAGGTQTQIAERPAAPLGQRILGGAAGGASLGSIFGVPRALLGGLGGGLFGGLWG